MNDKYPPLTTACLVAYSALNSFSEVVPAEKMAELERKLQQTEFELIKLRVEMRVGKDFAERLLPSK